MRLHAGGLLPGNAKPGPQPPEFLQNISVSKPTTQPTHKGNTTTDQQRPSRRPPTSQPTTAPTEQARGMAEDGCPRPSNEAGCAKGDLARTDQIKPRHQQTAANKTTNTQAQREKACKCMTPQSYICTRPLSIWVKAQIDSRPLDIQPPGQPSHGCAAVGLASDNERGVGLNARNVPEPHWSISTHHMQVLHPHLGFP